MNNLMEKNEKENMDRHVTVAQDCSGETAFKQTEDTVCIPTVCMKCNQCPCLWDQNRSDVERMIQRLKMDSATELETEGPLPSDYEDHLSKATWQRKPYSIA